MKSGRVQCQKAEKTWKDFNIVLILQEQFCTTELFKVIQDAILLILRYRTMSWFWTVSSSTFITLDVRSIYIPSSIQDWYREVKIWAKDRQYSFCLWFLWAKNTRILTRSTENTTSCLVQALKHGRNIKTRCTGSTSILLKRKDWSSIRHDRTLSFFTKHSQLIVFRKLFGWKLKKSYTKKCMRHLDLLRRFPWNMIGWRNWVQKLLDDQKEKWLDKQQVPNQPNQSQIQITIERGDPLCAQKTRPVLRKSIHVSLVKARTQYEEENSNHDSTGRPVVCREPVGSPSTFNEVDIDFRIFELPHAVVKQAENSRVRELVKKIENHPHRQDLQADLQQNNAYNPFSEKSKKMFKEMGNVELCALCATNCKEQCKVPSFLESRRRLLHLPASLERKWSQPRRHSMYIGHSFNSKLCH